MENTMSATEMQDLKSSVKEKYGQAALRVSEGKTEASCCGSSGPSGRAAWNLLTQVRG